MQESKVEETICVTPTILHTRTKKPITLRRNRTPPLLKLTKVSMNFSDDEDNTSSPPIGYKRTSSRNRLTRRKILSEEYTDSHINEETNKSKDTLLFDNLIEIKEENLKNISMKDIIKRIASLAPDISEHLCNTVDKLNEPATTKNVQKLFDTIKSMKVNAASQKNIRKTRHSKHVTSSDYNNINDVIALFKDFGVNEKKDNSEMSSRNDARSERKEESTSSLKKDSLLCQQRSRISGESDIETFESNSLPINQCDKLDNLRKACSGESTRLRITRSSAKHGVINKESHNIKTRKSKEKST